MKQSKLNSRHKAYGDIFGGAVTALKTSLGCCLTGSFWTLAFLSLIAAAVVVQADSVGWLTCAPELGGGVCPAKNTCCAVVVDDTTGETVSGCVPSDLGSFHATCCSDGTACGEGYECTSSTSSIIQNNTKVCRATDQISDPLVQQLPRYRLCTAPDTELLKRVYGLSMDPWKKYNRDHNSSAVVPAVDHDVQENHRDEGKLVYYSTHGDLLEMNMSESTNVKIAIVVVHGAGRNADDYFCSVLAAAREYAQRKDMDPSSILVIAPRFAQLEDTGIDRIEGGGMALQWPIDGDGTWRYGAESAYPYPYSSFDCMDSLLYMISGDRWRFSSLQRIVLAGHSSGGQLVQRWTLLTSIWDQNRFHAVVVNPSSYAYLIPERFVDGEWKLPNESGMHCPGYNQWEWGLDMGGNYCVRYLEKALKNVGYDLDLIKQRFSERRTIYMIGSQDQCNISERNTGWCNSHGLEATCADQLQGTNRLERHCLYYQSLIKLSGNLHFCKFHHSVTVPGVGHDHSLVFNSQEGMLHLFESDVTTSHCESCSKGLCNLQ